MLSEEKCPARHGGSRRCREDSSSNTSLGYKVIKNYRYREVGCDCEENLQKIAKHLGFTVIHPGKWFIAHGNCMVLHTRTMSELEEKMCLTTRHHYRNLISIGHVLTVKELFQLLKPKGE